jgi:hypothetical protein
MQRADVSNSRMITTQLPRVRDQTSTEEYSHMELPPSPTSSTDAPVFVTSTPPSDTPPSSSMSGIIPTL